MFVMIGVCYLTKRGHKRLSIILISIAHVVCGVGDSIYLGDTRANDLGNEHES